MDITMLESCAELLEVLQMCEDQSVNYSKALEPIVYILQQFIEENKRSGDA